MSEDEGFTFPNRPIIPGYMLRTRGMGGVIAWRLRQWMAEVKQKEQEERSTPDGTSEQT